MSKLSLDTLFPESSNDALNVTTLYESNFVEKPDINKLIKTKQIKKNKLKNCYKNILKNVYKMINDANNSNRSEIIYQVPQFGLNNDKYDPKYCMSYIEKKLRGMNFDLLRLSKLSLFITWYNIGD